ncbi:MAG: biopolymer transporter ExbD [Lentisphaerae bacterium]|jgi:biopolymer transport protein ExbD|nr:biopolymer transporter ExbD [Lentisphaerota bacterium]MBT4819642.1 biopolymer transporter ExbD [Lentisphaerota bacterium]MBT5611901.1 biopolymer transporter ExbD [Lentisphaerota bacterium]MBT7055502.1 biopolymer transporter ExbD [Lentisphaerota bacterium]MBT7847518.1 biopolymer transporter ExbD [Lentisphaerota bacterium]
MRRKRKPVTVPVASMGDIAFLLIIFFILCSNFVRESAVELQPPRAEALAPLKETQVSVSIDKEGVVRLQGAVVSRSKDVEWGVRGLLARRATETGQTVLFKCDENVEKDVFEPVLDAIARGGGIVGALGEKRKAQ